MREPSYGSQVDAIARGHGGSLEVESGPDSRTEFTIIIPLEQSQVTKLR